MNPRISNSVYLEKNLGNSDIPLLVIIEIMVLHFARFQVFAGIFLPPFPKLCKYFYILYQLELYFPCYNVATWVKPTLTIFAVSVLKYKSKIAAVQYKLRR